MTTIYLILTCARERGKGRLVASEPLRRSVRPKIFGTQPPGTSLIRSHFHLGHAHFDRIVEREWPFGGTHRLYLSLQVSKSGGTLGEVRNDPKIEIFGDIGL